MANTPTSEREAARGFHRPKGFWFGRYRARKRWLQKAVGWAKLKSGRAEAGGFPLPW